MKSTYWKASYPCSCKIFVLDAFMPRHRDDASIAAADERITVTTIREPSA